MMDFQLMNLEWKVPDCRNVRFGSKADMCAATSDVRYYPNSDRKSRHAAKRHVYLTKERGHRVTKGNARFG